MDQPERKAFQQLETAVGNALTLLDRLRGKLKAGEARGAELQELVRRFTGDEAEADRLLTRLRSLETENGDLRRRLTRGRQTAERLLAKIRFLEEQR